MELKQKGISLYFQIEEYISEKIQLGEWAPGQKIPTEAELSEQFSVSRATVRQGIADLSHEGLLVKRQGLGTFVAEPARRGNYSSLSFWSELGDRHILKRFSVVNASHSVSSCLGLSVGSPVSELYRLRCADDMTPIAVMKSYFSAELFPMMERENLEGLLYQLLRSRYGLSIHHIKSDIEPVMPTFEERRYLNIHSENIPTLLLCWTCYDVNDRPIILTKHILSCDRCKFSVTENYSY